MNKSTKKWAIGAMLAAVAGYIAGILTAPKSGKETRADIKQAAETGMAEAEKELKKLHTQINTLIAEGKQQVARLTGVAQKELQGALDKAGAAKEKARVMLSALHEGDAEDQDLKKAIKEADKALNHLKQYIKK